MGIGPGEKVYINHAAVAKIIVFFFFFFSSYFLISLGYCLLSAKLFVYFDIVTVWENVN